MEKCFGDLQFLLDELEAVVCPIPEGERDHSTFVPCKMHTPVPGSNIRAESYSPFCSPVNQMASSHQLLIDTWYLVHISWLGDVRVDDIIL